MTDLQLVFIIEPAVLVIDLLVEYNLFNQKWYLLPGYHGNHDSVGVAMPTYEVS